MKPIKHIPNTSATSSSELASYNQTIQYLYNRLAVFHQVGSVAYKPGLDNTILLLNNLQNPHNQYKTIHVAGTNGKGSVSHFLAAILQSAGYKVGLYTSPHLVDFAERIRVNGNTIDKQYVVDFVEKNKCDLNAINPSFFEATMAMAFSYFADCNVDIAVVETGLGGRLDSTNIIKPILSVITNISLDHVSFLGDSIEKIAFEKAGIIKASTPVVIGEALSESRLVFEAKAKLENAPIIFAEERSSVAFKAFCGSKMHVLLANGETLSVGLCGLYQLKNIATTLTAVQLLKQLNFCISEEHIKLGFEFVTELTGLQGRWQVLQQQPTVVADTGHNVAGIEYVVEQLKVQKYKMLRIVIGMVNDKDIASVLALLPPHAQYYFTQANIARALPAVELQKLAESYKLYGGIYSSVREAFKSAKIDSLSSDFILVVGSNFVVGELLEHIQNCSS